MSEPQGRMTLWGIEVFLATADEGAISSAARRLGVSASAVSQQISALESALNCTLLDRSARPLRITPAGEMFRRHAHVMLNAAHQARAELATSDLSSLSTLRLGMIEDFEADVTPMLLSTLAKSLRHCRFILETGPSHRLLDQLDSKALDLVVTADLPDDHHVTDPNERHPLLQEPFLAIRPKDQAAHDLPLIHYARRTVMGSQINAHLARIGLDNAPRYELDSYHAILALVAAGEGWTILPPLALHQAPRFRDAIRPEPLPFAPLSRSLSLQARPNLLRDVPGHIAQELRDLISREVIHPMIATYPWLAQDFKVQANPDT